jgi:hypothetical protein
MGASNRRLLNQSPLRVGIFNGFKGSPRTSLQPSDWITYEGIGPALDPISVLRRLADLTGDEWAILPQWHSSDVHPSDDLMNELTHLQQNILHVPSEFRIAHSEHFLPFADGLATISSNVSSIGAIMGKELHILGKSKFNKMNGIKNICKPRYDILAFLVCRYCRSLDEFLINDGDFAEHIIRLRYDPKWLFESNKIEPSKLEDFLSLAPAASETV